MYNSRWPAAPPASLSAGLRRIRTLLFAPGSEARKLRKLTTFGADAVAIDLEDAVADSAKDAARAAARAALESYEGDVVKMVRINGVGTGRAEEDLAAIVCPALAAVLVPKLESASELASIDEMVSAAETRAAVGPGSIRVVPILETAVGIARCDEILASPPPRVHTVIFGIGDYSLDLGLEISADASELLYARSRIVNGARAAGLAPPIDGPYLNLADLEGLAEDCARSRRLGFQGRVVVYPQQVATAARSYSWVSEADVRRAKEIVEAFERSEKAGIASIRLNGEFIDYPIYDLALEQLRLYAQNQAEA